MRAEPSRAGRGRIVAALIVALAVGAVAAYALSAGQRAPSGPADVAWDRQPCAHCGMLVGEPAFAAQLQAGDGEVLFFDDPGCLFAYLADHPDAAGAPYFHHLREARWLRGDEVGFVRVPESPMGYGLGAVARGGAVFGEDEARSAVAAHRRGRGARPEDG